MKRTICVSMMAALLASAAPSHGSPAFDAARNCRKAVSKMGQYYTHKRRVKLLNCINRLLICEVQSEADSLNVGSCRSSAETSCKNNIGPAVDTPLSKAAAKFDLNVGLGCGPADFSTQVMSNAAGGLWYSNDAECGTSADVPTLADCLRVQLAKNVDIEIGDLKPRAGILLDNIGLGVNFPDLPRPPVIDVTVYQTAPASGVLVDPGTLAPPSGSGIRFAGDATTLTCGGMGNNGRVTVTILSPAAVACNDTASILQQFSFKEPFSPTNTVTAGPFTSDAKYCVGYKKSSCDDEVMGTIDVP